MNFNTINRVYFLGIGGIGMSALARYFNVNEKLVAGYDRTETPLTKELVVEGMAIHYTDSVTNIDDVFKHVEDTLIVRTPAVPDTHAELNYFRDNGFAIMKRAQVLGLIFNANNGIAIAGTHGKTSVSTFTSYLMNKGGIDCNAFLGGISKNFGTNLVLGKSDYVIAEADEYDRSFLQLHPKISLVTCVDADHLDIYEDYTDIKNTFTQFLNQTIAGGSVIVNEKVQLDLSTDLKKYTYSLDNAETDFYASDIKTNNGIYTFNFHALGETGNCFELSVPGLTNVENAIAAMAVACVAGIPLSALRHALPGLKGVVRRFDTQFAGKHRVYIDDYAHHPRELDAVISSVRHLYKDKKLTGIFQPHLYSRTKDFAPEFAESLSKLDELILLDIYPAREEPIPGISAETIMKGVSISAKQNCSKNNLLHKLKELNIEVLLTLGAGDIDQLVEPIKNYIAQLEEN